MKKIKLIISVALVASLLGISSLAAVTTTSKGVQKLDSADIVDALNNNADVLDGHIDKIAGTDTLGHVKIGSGLQLTEDGTTSVKIANDLETDDATTALSAAMGVELSNNLNGFKIYGGKVALKYSVTNQLVISDLINLSDLDITEVYSFVATINYSDDTQNTVYKTDRVHTDLEVLQSTGELRIYANTDDYDYTQYDQLRVSYFIIYK